MRARDKAADPADEIEADFGELSQLVSVIQTLIDELSRNGSLVGQIDEPDLADALGQVERNWNKQRVTLQTFLDSAAGSVRATLTAYRELESELAQAAVVGAD